MLILTFFSFSLKWGGGIITLIIPESWCLFLLFSVVLFPTLLTFPYLFFVSLLLLTLPCYFHYSYSPLSSFQPRCYFEIPTGISILREKILGLHLTFKCGSRFHLYKNFGEKEKKILKGVQLFCNSSLKHSPK